MWKSRLQPPRLAQTLAALVLAFIFLWTYIRLQHSFSYNGHAVGRRVSEKIVALPPGTFLNATRPANQKIIGLIFYGRQDRVRLLNCYLERNLPEQGGWLSEVHFIRNTDNQADLAYLNELLATHPQYKMLALSNSATTDMSERYRAAWELISRDTIYVKIDDDVVWLADDAIPRLIMRKLRQTDYLLVSANMINSPLMSKVHLDRGAYHPYLPAHNASTSAKTLKKFVHDKATAVASWDFHRYPNWTGPADYSLKHDDTNEGLSEVWLRMPDDALDRTPAQGLEYATWGPGLTSWSIAAQSHLSLLENIRTGTTNLYYHELDEVWFTDYDRLSINLIALWSNDILDNLPVDVEDDDEHWLTVALPMKLQKRVAVETHALAAHFAFGYQLTVNTTDILPRYADYAHEEACLRKEQFGQQIFGE